MNLATRVRTVKPYRSGGRVAGVTAQEIEVRGLLARVGDSMVITSDSGVRYGEVISLSPESTSVMLFSDAAGIGKGDAVHHAKDALLTQISDGLIGRVVDGLGRPIDDGPPIVGETVSVENTAPPPLERQRIDTVLPVGVKAIDTICTVGRGQRIGIFGGSGVGKSSLLGMMAKGTTADITVLALIGERGREVREFIEDELGPEGMARAVVVVATSDQPALMRVRASLLATRISEWFADRGQDVLLMMDSLTRLAMAQREIGLAAGEPPTSRGYTPSVFSMMARLLERAGPRRNGTITGFYSVLVEGDDMNDPIADAARSILDGHIILDRRLAIAGRYPAIDPLASLSRLAPKLTTPAQRGLVTAIQSSIAAAEEVRELVEVGAYVAGSNPAADRGLAATPAIIDFLKQSTSERVSFDDAWRAAELLAPLVVA